MSKKIYTLCRVLITAAIGITVGISVLTDIVVLPLAAVFIGMGLLYLCRKNVKDVIADERVYRISERASRLTIAVFGPVAAVVTTVLLVLSNGAYPGLKPVAYTMAYLVSVLSVLYAVFYIYYERKI